jgi:hypothetical protein
MNQATRPNEEDGEEDKEGIPLDEIDPVVRTPSIIRKFRSTTRCAFPYESTFFLPELTNIPGLSYLRIHSAGSIITMDSGSGSLISQCNR